MNTYLQRLEADFAKHFPMPPITPPDPLAETEASEGVCALNHEDNGNEG